ncbi:MAG: ParA family protein [Gammaproteobacteria bacterium]
MANILALANQKGGVGKTTTAVNLAASLGAINRRVLVIDLDPQGNATMGCGVDKHQLSITSGDVLLGKAGIADGILQVDRAACALLPANGDQTVAEIELITATEREFRLRRALDSVDGRFDYVLIDCPPALNTLTVNALVAAHGVIIPMQCEYYALEGLSALIGTIERIRQAANPALRIAGLLRTMFDPRNNLANDVSNQLISHFGDRVFETVIPRNVRLAEAPSHGLPVLLYDKASRGALAYLSLAGELLRKERRSAAQQSEHLLHTQT